jgi:release factor glutamine methyltransferase
MVTAEMADPATDTAESIGHWLEVHRDLPRLEAELLICHHLGIGRAKLLTSPDHPIEPLCVSDLRRDAERLRAGEPLAYVVGERGFWDFTLTVTSDVLVPRPETETLVEQALEHIRPGDRILDLGTGSGAIAIALARSVRGMERGPEILAVDRSERALELAAENAARLNAEVVFRHSDWFDNVSECFDLIVANPPYVAEGDPHLASLRFEPTDALVSGEEGLDDLERIISATPAHLKPGGWLLVEHGFDQSVRVRDLFSTAGFLNIDTVRDLGNQPRVTFGRRPSGSI